MNNTLKILYLATSLKTGGTEKYLALLAGRFRSEYDITIGYLKENGATGAALEAAGFTVRPFNGIFDIASFLAMNDISLIHTCMYRANIIGRIAARLSHTPVIISTQQAIDSWKTRPYVFADAFTARWADKIIANSAAARDILVAREKIPACKIEVIYNGIDTLPEKERAAVASSSHRPTVISLTRLHREKGSDRLPLISSRVRDADFIIAGDGPERRAIEASAADLHLGGRFVLTGWVKDTAAFLAQGDIFLLTSREESMPQAILEAMAAGLPVVAADVGGVRELVDDGVSGFVVKQDDIDAYAAAINKLNASPELRRTMGAAGRKKAAGFTNEMMLCRTQELYCEQFDLTLDREY